MKRYNPNRPTLAIAPSSQPQPIPELSTILPPIPKKAKLHTLKAAAAELAERYEGLSAATMLRMIETDDDWGKYEGRIWCDLSRKSSQKRQLRIWLEGVDHYYQLPKGLR